MYVFSDMLGECTLHMMCSHASCVHTHVTPLNKRSPCQPMHSPPPLRPLGPRRSARTPGVRASNACVDISSVRTTPLHRTLLHTGADAG